ncbi:MAG: hypothetical protein PHF46_01770 [Candidatus Gracilibacteria bacterium]|nr:hypothetical protein [Candidatus Gracilibacteria bacterium]MDD3120113.1 hypothetical protein [Candidatus Gracilibacteria bacterium]MDD4530590.1 hypothetical protein [Candidatus Gracilibacteria bacterium]
MIDKKIKYYDLTGSNKTLSALSGEDLKIGDLIKISHPEGENFLYGFKGLKNIGELNSQVGRQLLEILFNGVGVSANVDSIKKIGVLSFSVRKLIKDNNSRLLEVLDSPDFLMSYIYLLIGFNFEVSGQYGKNSINSHHALASTIQKLIEEDNINFSGFLCAHRESQEIKAHSLSESINMKHFIRATNLLRGVAENLGKEYEMNFSHTLGDENGLNATFPSLFLNYFNEGNLFLMSEQLEKHFNELKQREDTNLTINSVSDHYKEVINYLKGRFGDNWGNIDGNELDRMAERGCKFSEIAYYMTMKDLERFECFHNGAGIADKEQAQKLIKLNIENAKIHGREEVVEKAIEMFFNRLSLAGKALYETAFYYLWGKRVKENNGVGVGFDRDHDMFQTASFSLGYSEKLGGGQMVPLIYSRFTGKKSGNTLSEISFRQFWHYD